MASRRATACWRSVLSRYHNARQISISPQFKINPRFVSSSSSSSHGFEGPAGSLRLMKADFVPIYTLFGMTLLGVFLGALALKQQLLHSPNVVVDKKKRRTIPEVKDPEFALKKSEDFVNKSFFRRVGQNTKRDSELSKSMPWVAERDTSNRPADTLKSVGVE